MRLGGPVFGDNLSPDQWVVALRAAGYRAAYCPAEDKDDDMTAQAYAKAAKDADIIISEVGAWSNPLSRDGKIRKAALELCQRRLDLADRIGARCCVNIAGSRGAKWDGPSPDDLTDDTFDIIVESARAILDAVKPKRTFYTIETMPWMYPDSPESYLRLIQAIDRRRFGAHLDPVNLISSPQKYFANGALIRECFRIFGSHIKSCHAKDILLADRLTVHLDEVRPGLGRLDYGVYLRELDRLDPQIPLMLEHLETPGDYASAAEYIQSVARG